ncbi:MAG: hypothetical protein K2U26_03690 [Cyclobacteriaceae bacterium]|nr:hypothetical protein [Cyclobacteriaceae bacterium]
MKTFKFHPIIASPIYRDLLVIVATGFFASAAIVTLGYMIVSQVSR